VDTVSVKCVERLFRSSFPDFRCSCGTYGNLVNMSFHLKNTHNIDFLEGNELLCKALDNYEANRDLG
jgi:hypothetical protein